MPGWLMFSQNVISIHALREESDFLSASSMAAACYFYPRSP